MSLFLAHRVKTAIEDSGVSVGEIAQRCGISVQAVYKWMSGASKNIDGEHLVELAAITKHSARWIIKGEGPKVSEYHLTESQARLLKVSEHLSESQVATLAKIGDTLAEGVSRTGTG